MSEPPRAPEPYTQAFVPKGTPAPKLDGARCAFAIEGGEHAGRCELAEGHEGEHRILVRAG
jgi:hypothetical protein